MWTWRLPGVEYRLTGVDNDAEALRRRMDLIGDLAEAVCADLRSADLPVESYDVVHSAYALEHIDGAEQALDRMYEALRPGGLLVIKIPDRDSVYAFLARYTPHRMHVLYKRVVRRRKLAGTPGHGPYPVVYDPVVSLSGLQRWAASHELETVSIFGDNSHIEFFGRFARAADLGLQLVARASMGHLTARYSNIIAMFAKPTALA